MGPSSRQETVLLNASVDVQRVIGRLRRPSSPRTDPATILQRRSLTAARHVRTGLGTAATSARAASRAHPVRPPITLRLAAALSYLNRLGHERTVALAAAGILLGASVLSVAPAVRGGATGGPIGNGSEARVTVGGSADSNGIGSVEAAYDPAAAGRAAQSRATDPASMDRGPSIVAAPLPTAVEGPFLEDGTLLKPVAVNTAVADGRDLMRIYKVRSGDTLTGIAAKFHISMMTLWWANNLKSKDALHLGQKIKIPPVNGLVIEVLATDTLASLAARYKVSAQDIVTTNGLEDQNLVVGQILVLPGANGQPIATRRAVRAPTRSPSPRHSVGPTPSVGSARPPRTYNGGRLLWPTTSHHISQYYHYGHYAIDIDGSTGDPIWAAAAGTVTFAGWKDNGGGYQVWIAHGSNLFTTYNHMSSVSVGRGQHVDRGQHVGRMGATGFATGSHLHFEVWRGPIWDGGQRVNPLAYL
jgi:murein DD-endopeptidase MepM/ murein hydrolase activator NlpD